MMSAERSVIVEFEIHFPDKTSKWIATEVRYEKTEDSFRLGKPEILSMRASEQRENLEMLLCALIGAKGEFFVQTIRAAMADEKRWRKREQK
jgi:hypothetical protein